MKESINISKVQQCCEVWYDIGGFHTVHAGLRKKLENERGCGEAADMAIY